MIPRMLLTINIDIRGYTMVKEEEIVLEPITPALIEEIRERIVKHLHPDTIILFGSAVKKTMQNSHDIDLYIVKRGVRNVREVERELEVLFAGRLLALDIIVRTPEQVEESLRGGNSFLKQEVIAKGKVLYAREGVKAKLS
jgi:predicted nucleotidyltransferase